jgi:hypothetical protein
MTPAIIADIEELRSKNALVRLTCDCDVLVTDYVPRAVFSARYHETHELAVCSHVRCRMGHRCGQTQADGQHRGLCGPTGPQKPAQPAVSPTPDSPPAALACGICGANMALDPFHACPSQAILQKPVRKAPRPVPTPVHDDGLDASWADLLDGATPVLVGR